MTLYIQNESYHFDGYITGVIIDNQKTAIFNKTGIDEHNLNIENLNSLVWYDLDSFEIFYQNATSKACKKK